MTESDLFESRWPTEYVKWYEKAWASACHHAFQIVRRTEHAEDIVSEAIRIMLQKNYTFEHQGQFHNCLLIITRRLAFRADAKNRAEHQLDLVELIGGDVDEQANAEVQAHASWCLDQLIHFDQDLIRAYCFQGLTIEAIALRNGSSRNTASKRLHKAKARLRKLYWTE